MIHISDTAHIRPFSETDSSKDASEIHKTLHKRLRDCLVESVSLRTKAMRTCDGCRQYRNEHIEKKTINEDFASNSFREKTSESSQKLLSPVIVSAESKLANILKIPITHRGAGELENVNLDRSSFYQKLPPFGGLPTQGKKEEISLICSSLVNRRGNLNLSNEAFGQMGRQTIGELLCFYEKCMDLREIQENNDVETYLSQLARSIQKIQRLRIFSKLSRPFWDEFLLIGFLTRILAVSEKDEDIPDTEKYLHAHHISLELTFHQEIVSSLGKVGSKNCQTSISDIPMVHQCLQHFVDCPDSSISDFLHRNMSSKDIRYYIDMYCEFNVMKNVSQVTDSEWLRIFHCLRAGRVDATSLYKSGFEGIEVIMEHIRSTESSGCLGRLRSGSEKIALLYRKELEATDSVNSPFDPFKLAVLLYFSGKNASEQDVLSGLRRLYHSEIFTMTNKDNFLWITMVFPNQVDMLFLVQHHLARHPALKKNCIPETKAIFFNPFPAEKVKLDNMHYFSVYQRSFLEGLSRTQCSEDVIPMAIYFMLMISDDPSLPLQTSTFWRDHLVEVFNNFKDAKIDVASFKSFSQDADENVLISGIKRAICPIQSMFADVFLGTQRSQRESHAVVYAVKLLALFSTEQKSDLIVELNIAKTMGKFKGHEAENIFTNIDSKGLRTSQFFNCMMNYGHSSADDKSSSPEEEYRSITRLIIEAAEKAFKRGFAHISIQLLLDAYVFLAHQKILDDELEKNLLHDITQSLMREIQKCNYRNSFSVIDISNLLRDFFRSNSDRISTNLYHEFLTFHKAVGIYREIQAALQKPSGSKDIEYVCSSKYTMKQCIAKMDTLSIQEILEKCEREFEEVYHLVKSETDLVTHGPWISSALRECCFLFINLLLALQESSQSKFSLRSHSDLHRNITRFLVWTKQIALHLEDESMLTEIQSLSPEFLGQTNLL